MDGGRGDRYVRVALDGDRATGRIESEDRREIPKSDAASHAMG